MVFSSRSAMANQLDKMKEATKKAPVRGENYIET